TGGHGLRSRSNAALFLLPALRSPTTIKDLSPFGPGLVLTKHAHFSFSLVFGASGKVIEAPKRCPILESTWFLVFLPQTRATMFCRYILTPHRFAYSMKRRAKRG